MTALAPPTFKITDRALREMRAAGVPGEVLQKLAPMKNKTYRGVPHFMGNLPLTHYEITTYSLIILEAAKIRSRIRRQPQQPFWKRLKKITLKHALIKILNSSIVGTAILLAMFGLDLLTEILFNEPSDIIINVIKWAKNWGSFAGFMVFLMVKLLDNLGLLGEGE